MLRKVVFWGHLACGVTAGLVVGVMAATGVLLAFEEQVLERVERSVRTVPEVPGAARLGPRALLDRAREVRGQGPAPTGLTLFADPRASASISLGREDTLFLDPTTGAFLGAGARGWRDFFHEVTDLHRWLGAHGENRDVGRAITGASNAAFLGLVLSGAYLWLPQAFTRRHLRPVALFQPGLAGKARDFNWHNVIGLWSWPILLVVTASGVLISYPAASGLLYTVTGSAPPSRGAGGPPGGSDAARRPPQVPDALDQLWAEAERRVPGWTSISLRLPAGPGAPVSFFITEGGASPGARSRLTLDPATGVVKSWEPHAEASAGRRLQSWVRPLHTGEAFGVPGQFLAALASAGAVVLVYTGLALSWRRLVAWRRRQAEPQPGLAEPV